ncbi:MAG: hypothetical protein HY231_03250 [Acidobacteria bacterium]|nr:hypothetical protein [Acidobacteriota bacterium]
MQNFPFMTSPRQQPDNGAARRRVSNQSAMQIAGIIIVIISIMIIT